MANGEIIGQTIEADCTRIETTDKFHKPPQIETKSEPPTKRRSKTQTSDQPEPPFVQQVAPPPEPVAPPQVDPQHPDFDEYEDESGDDDSWLDPPSTLKLAKVVDDVALQVIDLLEGKKIEYDIILNGINGIISANSYDRKELLKSSGFRWSSDTKRWIFKFINEPF